MYKMKLFATFALLLFIFIGYRTYTQFNDLQNTEKIILLSESEAIAGFVDAFRQTYQSIFITNHIEIDEQTLNLLPVKTISDISERFSENVNGDIMIRTVSDRPRNIDNMANQFELEQIQYFKNNPEKTDNFVHKKDSYFYTQPMYIKPLCMKCHGKREDAIPSIRQKYATAYDYKLGDIRGLLNIEVKKRSIFKTLYADFIENLMGTFFLYIFFLVVIYLLIQKMRDKEEKYTHELENEIEAKTKEIEKQKDTFETLFEKSSDGISILYDGVIIQCNEKIVEILKYETKEKLLNVHLSLLSPEYQPDGRLSYEKAEEMIAVTYEKGWHQFEWVHKKADGEEFIVELTLTPIVLDDKNVIHGVWRDISDKKKAEIALHEQKDMLDFQAHHDALTGLPNRVLFLDRLEHAIEHAKRHYHNIAIFFIDLDYFKEINDSLGHHVGDMVLVEVTKRFKSHMREIDTLARLGGDEFTIVMEELENIENATFLAEKIEHSLVEPIQIDGHRFYLTCSIGISAYPQDSDKPENLLKFADTAMYHAKEEGRNNMQFYASEMTDHAQERLSIQTDLRQALERDEFVLYYQPQIDVKNQISVGLEALIRWNHPQKGLLLPAKFIDIAELSGLIVIIDKWVMEAAMKQFVTWHAEGLNPGLLSLNLSMRQLRSGDFIDVLKKNIEKFNFDPKWLELEITESQVMRSPEESISKLEEISNMGIQIAIDDFGTGYSSLAYLKRLPVNKIKIDKSFIRGIPHDQENVEIVKAIIALANSLGLNIIAEGVETEEERDELFKYDCAYVQGHFYFEALPAIEIKERILKK
ncbi:MAG: GGDEF domain-containing protein [Epsilonproteobacteria bacterium]|nr:MAG: GGDEF domain-containing protein [Campylobacterota bacterium]